MNHTLAENILPSTERRYQPKHPDLYGNRIACFTGHRNVTDVVAFPLGRAIHMAVDSGINHFFVGMALGSDQLAAKVLVSMNLPWTAVIPCEDQAKLWSISQRKEFECILRYAKSKVILQAKYSASCMHIRNQYMIDHSESCIAIYDGRLLGGTANTIRLAKSKSLELILVNPSTMKISRNKKPLQLDLLHD
jgi:uncharacterized phage-like protein YoqJ